MENDDPQRQSRSPKREPDEFPAQIARLYSLCCLDAVVEIASLLADDFAARPQLYRRIDPATAKRLSSFKQLGSDPQWPNREQRTSFYTPLFGARSVFGKSLPSLFAAARLFAERHVDTGLQMLTQSFVDKAVLMRAGLLTYRGAAVSEALVRTEAVFTQAIAILKDQEVAHVFALPPAEGDDWPVQLEPSGDGATLVQAVSTFMAQSRCGIPVTHAATFMQLQLTAARGGEAIRSVLRSANEPLQQLNACYAWQTSIAALQGDTHHVD
jgi:hypothetical protein